ncbi:nickel-dependent lactate racemase [Thermodesulfobacteriota bacterium]
MIQIAMGQDFSLKYGTRTIPFDLPDRAEIFQITEPEIKITPAEFRIRLGDELERLKPDLSDVSVVLSDKTRLCEYPVFLPVLLKTLESFGADPDRMTLFIAYGTHQRQTDEECISSYGTSYLKYRFVHHDCGDSDAFSPLGHTARGTPVLIRRDILEIRFLITFGSISHHYFAGYGGGRKLTFPGLGHRNAIYHNHGLFLDKDRQTLSPFCLSGKLNGNPLAEDLAEIETYRPADLSIHAILDSQGRVCNLLPGVGTEHFRNACNEHGKNCEIITDRQFDLVIASCGGYPKDINFIQSHKAIENAAKFVRDGGRLIILAECGDGIGSETFLPWFDIGGREKAFNRLAKNYEGNGGTALSMMSKLQRISILMVTDLSDSESKTIGFEKISMDQVLNRVRQSIGAVAVIPDAGLVVKVHS